MFGIGFTELVLILVLALLVLGPDKIPAVAKTLARVYREVRTTGAEFTQILKDEVPEMKQKDPWGLDRLDRQLGLDDRSGNDKNNQSTDTQKPKQTANNRWVQDWSQTVDLDEQADESDSRES